jgi:hypothetical protein
MSIDQIPVESRIKDRFTFFGDSDIETEKTFNDAVARFSSLIALQEERFRDISTQLTQLLSASNLPRDVQSKFLDGADKAKTLAKELSKLKSHAGGIFVEYSEAIAHDRVLNSKFSELTANDRFILSTNNGINDELAFNAYANQLVHWNNEAQEFSRISELVKAASDNYSEYLLFSEAIETANDISTVMSLGGGLVGSVAKKSVVVLAREAVEAVLDWAGIPTSLTDIGTEILDESAQSLTINSQLIDEYQTLSGIIVHVSDQKDFSTGYIKDSLFAVARDGVATKYLDLSSIESWFSTKNVSIIGSDGADTIKVPVTVPGYVNIVTKKGNDTVIVDKTAVIASLNLNIDTGEDNDIVDLLGYHVKVNAGSGDDNITIRQALDIDLNSGSEDDYIRTDYTVAGSIHGGAGFDTVDYSDNRQELRSERFDRYSGGLKIRTSGSKLQVDFSEPLRQATQLLESIEKVTATPNDDGFYILDISALKPLEGLTVDGIGGKDTVDFTGYNGAITSDIFEIIADKVSISGVNFENFEVFRDGDNESHIYDIGVDRSSTGSTPDKTQT